MIEARKRIADLRFQISNFRFSNFKFQILDPYLFNKTVNSIDYDFSVIEGKSNVIFYKSGKTSSDGSLNTISVPFPSNFTGPVTIGFENLNGNSFADSEFSAFVMNPSSTPEFPATSLYVLLSVLVLVILLTRINFVNWNNRRM